MKMYRNLVLLIAWLTIPLIAQDVVVSVTDVTVVDPLCVTNCSAAVEISMDSMTDVYGVQITLEAEPQLNLMVTGASGGIMADNNFMVSTSEAGIILGFSMTGGSLPAGSGILVVVDALIDNVPGYFDISLIPNSFVGFAGSSLVGDTGEPYFFGEISGCTDPEASNYNPDATLDDGSCEYIDLEAPTNLVAVGGDNEIALTWDPVAPPAGREDVTLWVSDVTADMLEISMTNTTDLYGFQFNVAADPAFNLLLNDAIGGAAIDQGFMITGSNTLILGFSLTGSYIPAGTDQVLLQIGWTGDFVDVTGCISLENVIVSGPGGAALSYEVGTPFCTGVQEEITYNIYRDGLLLVADIAETSFTDAGLGFAETHCYTVTAVYGELESAPSNEACATTDPEEVLLEAPQNLVAVGGENDITLSWDSVAPPAGREDVNVWISDVTADYLEISMTNLLDVYGFQFNVVADPAFNMTLADVLGGVAMEQGFMVTANQEGTILGFSMTGGFILDAQDQLLVQVAWTGDFEGVNGCVTIGEATFAGQAGVQLSTSIGDPFCTGVQEEILYNIYRDGLLLVAGMGEPSFTDAGLGFDETHCYTVTAVYGELESAPSNEACATTDPEEVLLDAPQNLVAVGGDNEITLTWDAVTPTGARTDVTLSISEATDQTLTIWMENTADVAGVQFDIISDENISAVFGAASGGSAAAAGWMVNTNETGTVLGFSLTGSTVPPGASALTYVEWTPTGIDGFLELDITNVAGPGGTVLSYEAGPALCYGSCFEPTEITYNIYRDGSPLAVDIAETTYTDGGLGFDETHCYTVTAHDAEVESEPSNEDCATTNPEIITLEAPQNLVAVGGENQIALTWDAVVPAGARNDVTLAVQNVTATEFDIYMVNSVNVYGFQFNLVADENLDPTYGSAYGGSAEAAGFVQSVGQYNVLGFSFTGAYIPTGEGILCTVSWTPAGIDGYLTLSDLIISGPGGTPIDAAVGSPACYGNCLEPQEITYNVYRDGVLLLADLVENNYLDLGLGYDETHCYTVTAFDGENESMSSNEDCATTDPELTTLEPPQNLVATGGDGEIVLTWDAVTPTGARTDVVLTISDATAEYVSIYMENSQDVSGVQLTVLTDDNIDAAFGDAFGGNAEVAGWLMNTNESGTILGFSLTGAFVPAGEGLLTNIYWSPTGTDGYLSLDITNDHVAGLLGAELSAECGPDYCYGICDEQEIAYNIYRDGTLLATDIDQTTYTDDGLGFEETYCYTVTAFDGENESEPSNEDCATTDPEGTALDAPQNLAAEGGMLENYLTWDPVNPPASRADVNIYVSDVTADYLDISMTSTADLYGFQFNLEADPAFNLQLGDVIFGAALDFGFMTQTSGDLLLGFSLTGSFIPAGVNQLLLRVDWTGNFDGVSGCVTILDPILSGPGGTPLTYEIGQPFCLGTMEEITYNVYRDGAMLASGLSETSYTDSGLGFDETHCYTVTAAYGELESAFSNEACATTDPEEILLEAPQNLVAVGGEHEIVLTWDAVTPAGARTDVILSISEATDQTLTIWMENTADVAGVQFDIITDENISAIFGTASGGSAAAAGWMVNTNESGTVLGFSLTGSTVPAGAGALTYVEWTPTGIDGFLDLDITNVAGPGGTVLSYEPGPALCYGSCDEQEVTYNVYRDGSLLAMDVAETTYTDAGLGYSETHCYTVTAYNGEVESDHSNEDCATTDFGPPDVDAPENLVAIGGDNEIILTWDPVNPPESRQDVHLWISNFTSDMLEISMTNLVNVHGFQMDVSADSDFNLILGDVLSGVAIDLGFMVNTNAGGTILGFSLTGAFIPPGEGQVLAQIGWSGDFDGISGCVTLINETMAGPGGIPLSSDVDEPFCTGIVEEITYNIYREGVLLVSGISETTYTDTGLGFDETYCYYVTAFYGDEESAPSNPDCATTNPEIIVPDPPQNLMAVGGDNEIVLTWDAVSPPAGREDVTMFVQNITATSFDVYMINTANVYGFQFNLLADEILDPMFGEASGGSAADAGFNVTVSPANVLGFSFTGSYIPAGEGVLTTITWTPGGINGYLTLDNLIVSGPAGLALSNEVGDPACYGSCDEQEITYIVYRDGTLLAFEVAGTTYTDADLGFNETHCYTVTAFDGMLESDHSNQDCATTNPEGIQLDAPENLLAVGGENEIVLTWDAVDVEGARTDVTLSISEVTEDTITLYMVNSEPVLGFQLDILGEEQLGLSLVESYGGAAADAGWMVSTNPTGTVLGFSLMGTQIPAGAGVLTYISWDYTGMDGYLDLSITNVAGPGGTALSADTGPPVCWGSCDELEISYNVYRDGALLAADIAETTFTDAGLGFEETHCYTVTAADGEMESDHSNEDCATTDPEPFTLDPPQNLMAVGGENEIVVTWDAVTPDGARSDVVLSISDASDQSIEIWMENTDEVAGVQFDILMDDNITAVFGDAFGGSAADAGWMVSTNESGTVLGFSLMGNTIPAGAGILTNVNWTPTGSDGYLDLDITNVAGAGGITLSYEAGPTFCYDCGGQLEIFYNLYRDGVFLATVANDPIYIDSGLGFDETHCYTVTATDGEIESEHSNEDCATTDPELVVIEPPQNLVAMGGENEIVLTWDAVDAEGARTDVTLSISEVTEDTITLYMVNSEPVLGFQLDILGEEQLGLSLIDASGGSAADAGFMVSTNPTGTVLGFSLMGTQIPAGAGVLTSVTWNYTGMDGYLDLSITNVAGPGGAALSADTGPPVCWGSCDELEISYNVYRDGALLATDISETTYTDAGLGVEETYCYTVTATDGELESEHSNEDCATTAGLTPEHYVVDLEVTGESALVIIQDAIGLEAGDEIGLFDASGLLSDGECSDLYGEILVGAGIWMEEQLEIVGIGSVDNCDLGGWQLPGYVEGNPILARVWKAAEQQEYAVQITVNMGTGNWGNVLTAISLEVIFAVEQIIPVSPYMNNMFSFNVIPDDFSTTSILGEEFLSVWTDGGEYYVPTYGVDMIEELSVLEGYKGFSNSPDAFELVVSGAPVDLSTELTISPYMNNLVPFLPQEPMETLLAFAGHEDRILVVSSDSGEYWVPSMGVETLTVMNPGEGYKIALTGPEPLFFTYPEATALVRWDFLEDQQVFKAESRAQHYTPVITGDSHPIVLTDLFGDVQPGDEVAAFAGSTLVGATRIVDLTQPLVIAAWAEYNEYGANLPGYSVGDPIELRLWSSADQREYAVHAELDHYSYGVAPLSAGTITRLNQPLLPMAFELAPAFPNPFNPVTHIRYSLPEATDVQLIIYDLNGRKIAELVNSHQSAGSYQVDWQAVDQASGLYLVQIVTGDASAAEKVMLLK